MGHKHRLDTSETAIDSMFICKVRAIQNFFIIYLPMIE